jgi:uncharacterized protein YkwD
MSKLLRSTALLALLLAALVRPGTASAATTYTPESYAARLLTLFNAARQQHGLQAVEIASGTQTVAAAWTQQLASDRGLSHNPHLQSQLEAHGSSQWTVFGENVGDADSQDPDGLFDAYMASPEHRDNVLTKEYRYLGNAVVFAGGRAWNTMDFVDVYASGTPKMAPKPATQPAVHRAVTPRPAVVRPAAARAPTAHHSTSAAAAPRPLPRSNRSTPRTPMSSPSPVQVNQAAAPAVHVALPTTAPFDTRRVLVLAVAAMLVLHMAGLWVGVAARRTS